MYYLQIANNYKKSDINTCTISMLSKLINRKESEVLFVVNKNSFISSITNDVFISKAIHGMDFRNKNRIFNLS